MLRPSLENNRLVGGSSPPNSTTQSYANGDFPARPPIATHWRDSWAYFISASYRLDFKGRFGAFVSAPQNRVSRRRRLACDADRPGHPVDSGPLCPNRPDRGSGGGRLSWRPLSFQTKRAMSLMARRRTRYPTWGLSGSRADERCRGRRSAARDMKKQSAHAMLGTVVGAKKEKTAAEQGGLSF